MHAPSPSTATVLAPAPSDGALAGVRWALARQAPSRWVWFAVALSALGTWLLGGGALAAFSRGDAQVASSALF